MSTQAAYPAVLPGISSHLLFERSSRDSTWIVGVSELDRYLVVPSPALPAVMAVVERLDGSRAPGEIRDEIRSDMRIDLDVDALVTRLGRAELLQGSDTPARRPLTNSGLLALDLLSLSLERRSSAWWLNRTGALAWFGLLAGVAVLASAAIALGTPTPGAGRVPWQVFGAIVLVSITAHELSHMFAAAGVERRATRATLALFLAQIPMVYLSIPGIFTLTPWRRIWVWSAGCIANVTLALAALALAGFVSPAHHAVLAAAAGVNVALVKLNLVPFLPTDGYYIACTLLKEHNVRKRASETLLEWSRGRNKPQRLLVVVYAIVSVVVMVRLIIHSPLPVVLSGTLGAVALYLASRYIRREPAQPRAAGQESVHVTGRRKR